MCRCRCLPSRFFRQATTTTSRSWPPEERSTSSPTDPGQIGFDSTTRSYTVDPDGGADAVPFSFGDPDFNVKSLRLNAVFRWELKPGSTFYAVWTRQQQDFASPGVFAPGRDAGAMFRAPGDDVVMVKMAYRIGR